MDAAESAQRTFGISMAEAVKRTAAEESRSGRDGGGEEIYDLSK